jgi:hypothetical protein
MNFEYDALKPVQAYGMIHIRMRRLDPSAGPDQSEPAPGQPVSVPAQPALSEKERIKYDKLMPSMICTTHRKWTSRPNVVALSMARSMPEIRRYPARRASSATRAGQAHDGLYVKQSATISKGQYQQSFTLGRRPGIHHLAGARRQHFMENIVQL